MTLTSEQAREMGKKSKQGKRLSLRKCIDRMCKACIYDVVGGNGTWRRQTESCSDKSCPLYEARPLSDSSGETDALSVAN